MEGELCYSNVIFKAFDNDKSKELQSDDSVLYAEVKKQETTSAIHPKSSTEQHSVKESGLPPQDHQSEEKGVTNPISPSYRRATVCLLVLCVLLLSALTAVSILNYNHKIDNQNILTLYTEERTVNQLLLTNKMLLEREIQGFTTQNENLNSTLKFILKHSTLANYCQLTENGVWCKPCPNNWIQNGSSCYYFFEGDPWKTWIDSKNICKAFGAHLAIIDNVEEQEFVNEYVKFYYDEHHGYWIGLSKNGTGHWLWTSEAELKEGFWINTDRTSDCVLSMSSNNSLRSWKAANCNMNSKRICEMTVLTWPHFLNLST